MEMRILLTGAAGFVGSNLLARAKALGSTYDWFTVDRVPLANAYPMPASIRHTNVDLCDLEQTSNLIAATQPDAIIHLAGATVKAQDKENLALVYQSNLISTCNLLQALDDHASKPTHFTLASSGLVYGNQPGPYRETMTARPSNAYSHAKFLAEEAVLNADQNGVVDACILRPAVLYGHGQTGDMFVPSLVAALKKGQRFPMTAGEQTRDFVHVTDMADAVLHCLQDRLKGVFNIGSGTAVAMMMVGQLVGRLMNAPHLIGLGEIPYREHEVWNYALDASRLRATGWRPLIALEPGLRTTIWGESNSS
jgi:nucleoside-diphosphate-sugar epimerase